VHFYSIAPKLTYIIFECICYSLIEDGCKIKLQMAPQPSILTEGILSSPLLNLNHNYRDVEGFKERFNQIIDAVHYRRLIKKDAPIDSLSILNSDIASFLQNCGLDKDSAFQLGEIAAELSGNSRDHSESDCIVDVDVSSIHKHSEEDGKFIGVNLAIINFSDIGFGTLLEKNLENKFDEGNKHQKLKEIYKQHKEYFSKNYPEEIFFSLASLQPKISGQYNKSLFSKGGLGTLRLLKALKEKAFEDKCYLLTGTNVVKFVDNLFSVEEEWIGFNEENDFLLPPSSEVVKRSLVDLPGTAYNLNFIIKMKEE
ncbi:hypothetical protein, partial [Lactococcus petauri]|uniref:hypothetical protein n=2 Tax=Lactococcus petauri TaxID=1940789 RepID=UPI0022E4EC98